MRENYWWRLSPPPVLSYKERGYFVLDKADKANVDIVVKEDLFDPNKLFGNTAGTVMSKIKEFECNMSDLYGIRLVCDSCYVRAESLTKQLVSQSTDSSSSELEKSLAVTSVKELYNLMLVIESLATMIVSTINERLKIVSEYKN